MVDSWDTFFILVNLIGGTSEIPCFLANNLTFEDSLIFIEVKLVDSLDLAIFSVDFVSHLLFSSLISLNEFNLTEVNSSIPGRETRP